MNEPNAVLSLVTLGVANLGRSIAFYEALGFARRARDAEGVGFFQAGACAFAVWSVAELAKDSRHTASHVPVDFRGVALAWNCATETQVDAAIARAWSAGATIPKPPEKTSWGGYAGYFKDPDGHLWEVAHNPGFPLTEDGRLTLPD
ncbi:VOC family protein [Pseudolabrys taiwanensis]|uniref:VOC family protein n=1 Tax=Pseudolabrys taiwanensis TaxID=331696 RepID=A0A346A2I6_9HYPH|nr:VOC family protein [Pseudolabrys taiwanensis]AXK83383.1 VOC family protein [Pseudolabrys taiwanensis]